MVNHNFRPVDVDMGDMHCLFTVAAAPLPPELDAVKPEEAVILILSLLPFYGDGALQVRQLPLLVEADYVGELIAQLHYAAEQQGCGPRVQAQVDQRRASIAHAMRGRR